VKPAVGSKAPVRLPQTAFEKVWGSPLTEPWYRNSTNENIGEIWFTASDSVPLLVKLLFTSDNLSIQVHPGGKTGKTEMWHILRAEPGARIGLGLRHPVTTAELRRAAESGEIVDLLEWIPVKPGDTDKISMCCKSNPTRTTVQSSSLGVGDRRRHP